LSNWKLITVIWKAFRNPWYTVESVELQKTDILETARLDEDLNVAFH
jgi:hypothetical protein